MYLKSRVKLPDVHGKLTRLRRGDITYIKYEYDRYYDPEKKYTYPQRATIGKVCAEPTKGNNHDALLVMQKNRK